MKTKLLAMALLAGGSVFAQTRFSIGVGVGGYAPSYGYAPGYYAPYPPAQVVAPPYPGPGYAWVDGYASPYGGPWVQGYWSRRPYVGGYIAAPRFDNRYYGGGYRRDYDRGHQSYRRGYSNGFRGRR